MYISVVKAGPPHYPQINSAPLFSLINTFIYVSRQQDTPATRRCMKSYISIYAKEKPPKMEMRSQILYLNSKYTNCSIMDQLEGPKRRIRAAW